MKQIPVLLFLSLWQSLWMFVDAQPAALTLKTCQQKARENYPLIRQKNLLNQRQSLTAENLGKNYLPVINLNAMATYQSPTIEIPFSVEGQQSPVFPKDHYQITLDIHQTIYDGGGVKTQKDFSASNLDAEQQKVEVALYQLRHQVNSVFFAILLGEQTLEQIRLTKDDLEKKYKQLSAAVKEGAVIKSYADQVLAELMKLEQKNTEALSIKRVYVKSLSLLINEPLDENIVLVAPVAGEFPAFSSTSRPDVIHLQKQQHSIETLKEVSKVSGTPQIGAFAQLGYGQPGLDPFKTSFQPFYLIGARFYWNIFNWNESKNQRAMYSLQQQILSEEINTLDLNTRLQALEQEEEMRRLQKLIGQDEELIELRKSISRTASAQVDHGVITVTDYLAQLNAQYQAELERRVHELQLAFTYVEYLTTLGL